MPVWALSVQNEPLYAPPTYSGMKMLADEQAAFFGEALGPALAAAQSEPKGHGLRPQLGPARLSRNGAERSQGGRARCRNRLAPLRRRSRPS